MFWSVLPVGNNPWYLLSSVQHLGVIWKPSAWVKTMAGSEQIKKMETAVQCSDLSELWCAGVSTFISPAVLAY